MKRRSVAISILLVTSCCASTASAAFHLWYINEVFSNHDGSVQFIELYTAFDFQQFLNGQTLTSNGNTFTFTDSPQPTGNHYLLLATAGFDAIAGGATPNYEIPAHFFDPAGDTLTFAEFYDAKTFTNAPTDGVTSLNYTGAFTDGTAAANSPRNYAGDGGSVNVPPPPTTTGDYNGNHVVDAADYTVWQDTYGKTVANGAEADGSGDGTINDADFTFWNNNFGNPAPAAGGGGLVGGAVPEPAAIMLAVGAFVAIVAGYGYTKVDGLKAKNSH